MEKMKIAELDEEEEENDKVDTDAQHVSSINKMSLKSHPSPKYTGHNMLQKSCLKSTAKREKSYLACLQHFLLQSLQLMFIA
eukprot:10858181-Ditylum_brightwellii.AAC.1